MLLFPPLIVKVTVLNLKHENNIAGAGYCAAGQYYTGYQCAAVPAGKFAANCKTFLLLAINFLLLRLLQPLLFARIVLPVPRWHIFSCRSFGVFTLPCRNILDVCRVDRVQKLRAIDLARCGDMWRT